MGNYFDSLAWAAARPRTTVPSSRALGLLAGYPSVECGTGRPSGVSERVEQHVFAKLTAVPANAQVKDTDIRMSLGPPSWRPPE